MKVTKKLDIYSIMPYKIKGKCIYNKDTGRKLGCTKGSVKKYLSALYANVPDAKKNEVRLKLKEVLRKSFKESLINENAEFQKDNVKIKDELTKNHGINFEQFEIDKIKQAANIPINKEETDRGMELSFEKNIGENTFYFVIKKLVNQADSSKTSFKYIIFYVEIKNPDDLDKESTVYSKLSEPIKALTDNDKTDVSKKNDIESKLYNFIHNSMKVNI